MTTPAGSWPQRAGPLVIRPAAGADADQILRWRNLPDVTRWLIHTEVEPDTFRKTWLEHIDNPDDHSVVGEVDGLVIGTGSLEVSDGMGQTHVGGDTWRGAEGQLGYLIDPRFAGNGYATAIARALLDLAFVELGLHRVTAGCFADNHASWRIMEKLGMRREQHGVKDSWHAEYGWIDGYTYGILADEWPPVAQ